MKRSGEALVLEVENVFKIAVTYSRVREFLTSKSWEFQGKDEEMEMDSFRNKKTGKKVFVEDISEDFPVTFLMVLPTCFLAPITPGAIQPRLSTT